MVGTAAGLYKGQYRFHGELPARAYSGHRHDTSAGFLPDLSGLPGIGADSEELVRLFVDKAHLALNDGTMFGEPGKGFMRLNIGCPRSVLEQALKQLETAVADK